MRGLKLVCSGGNEGKYDCWPCPTGYVKCVQSFLGTISCVIYASKRYLYDLPQGGLEVPCKLIADLSCSNVTQENFLNFIKV